MPPPSLNLPAYEKPADAARRLGLSTPSVRRAIARGDLPSCRIGRRVLIPIASLEHLAESQVQS